MLESNAMVLEHLASKNSMPVTERHNITIERYINTERRTHTDRQTDRQAGRQADRQTDRQIDR